MAANVRYGSKADIGDNSGDVRFTPKSGHSAARLECRLCANCKHRGKFKGLLGTMAKANGGGAGAPAHVIFFIVYLSRRSSRRTWRPRHLLRRRNLEAQVHR